MILWKNMVIIGGALTLFYWMIAKTLPDVRERQWCKTLYVCCLVMMVTILSWNPYLVTMAVLVGTILYAISKGVPALPTIFVLTALVPVMRYRIGGLGGVNALLDLTTLSVTGIAILLAKAAFPKSFERNVKAGATDVAVVLFVIASAILANRGFSVANNLKGVIIQTLTFGMIYHLASRAPLKSPRFLIASFVFIGGALSLVLVAESLRHWPMFLGAYELKGIEMVGGRTLNMRYGLMRASGPFEDAIACSMFMAAVLIPHFFYVAKRSWKLSLMFAAACSSAGLWITFSRTGLVGLAVGVLVLSILRRKTKFVMLAGAVGGSALLLSKRLTDQGASGTSDYRVELFKQTMEVLRSNLILGDNNAIRNGKLNELIQGQGIVDLVNSYLGLMLDGGLVLLAIFLLVPLTAMFQAMRNRKFFDHDQLLTVQIVISQLVAYLVCLAFTSATDKNHYYVFLFTGAIVAICHGARVRFAAESKLRTVPNAA